MAVQRVQTKTDDNNGSNATSVTIIPNQAPAEGNLLVVHLHVSGSRNFNAPSGWTRAPNAATTRAHIYYKVATASEPSSYTFSFVSGSATRINAHFLEYSGIDTGGNPLDVATGNEGSGTTISTGTTGTSSQADALVTASHGANGNRTFSGQTNGFTGDITILPRSEVCEKIVSATGTFETTATLDSSATAPAGVIAVFKAASGAGPQTVSPGLIDQSGVTFAPTVTPGPVTVSPGLIDQAGITFDPSVTPGGVTVSPGLIDQAGVAFDPEVQPGEVVVSPGLIDQAGVVFDPSVSQVSDAQEVSPGLIDQAGVVFDPVVTPGVVTVSLDLIDQAGVVFSPEVSTPEAQAIEVGLIEAPVTVFEPQIVRVVPNPEGFEVFGGWVGPRGRRRRQHARGRGHVLRPRT